MSMPKPTVIAVTGGTGFVGRATLHRLTEAGYNIRALTRKTQKEQVGVTWIEGSLDKAESLNTLCHDAQCIIHIAGVVNAPNREGFEKGNIDGTAAILKAAKDNEIKRFIHISSLSAREPSLSNYGASKAKAEKLVGASMLDWTMIRPPGIYGPHDTDMLDLFKMAQKGYILLPPKGKASLIHVDDLARLITALVPPHEDATAQIFEADDGKPGGWPHKAFGHAIGLAMDKHITAILAPKVLLKIAAIGDRLFRGKKAKLTQDRANYLSHPDWVIDPKHAPPKALWEPLISTRQGLKDTVRWYRKNDWINPEI